jgi:hypothetical protein
MKVRCLLPLLFTACTLAAFGQESTAPLSPPPAPAPAPAPAPPSPAPPAASELETPAPPPPRLPVPAPKADPALDLMPAQPGQLLPPPPMTEPGLIPEAPDARPKARSSTKEKSEKSKTQAAEEELATLIHLRQAKTRALATDPSLETEFHDANAAHTDAEKRAALQKYYARLYARIRKIDPRVKKIATEREQYAIRRLNQTRITPSEVVERDIPTGFNPDNFLGADF